MSFVKDLSDWIKAQIEFAKVLLDTEKIISLEFAQWRFTDWDIKINTPGGEKTYEIKSDRQAEQTGNYVIETRFKWNPSWIFTSKADIIVYYIKWQWWVQERGELILRLMNTEKRETKWWDWFNSTLWVISCDKLPNLFNLRENGETRLSDNWNSTEFSKWV